MSTSDPDYIKHYGQRLQDALSATTNATDRGFPPPQESAGLGWLDPVPLLARAMRAEIWDPEPKEQ